MVVIRRRIWQYLDMGTRHLSSMALGVAIVAVSCTGGGADGAGSVQRSDVAPATTTTSEQVEPPESTTTTTVVLSTGADGVVVTSSGVDPDSKVISIGVLADLSGLFAETVRDITDAQRVYWNAVNASGGIDGWTVELVIKDTGLDVDRHAELYEMMRGDVVAISQATGSSTNLATLDLYKEDDMLVIPLSWYSGWAIPEFDGGVMLEQNTNYCLEAMNILDFIDGLGGSTIGLATFDDDYGKDSAAGVKKAIDFYGMDLVFDGESAVFRGQSQSSVIQGIARSGADWTYLATSPSLAAEIVAGAAAAGYEGLFTGSSPTYDFRLLDTAAGPLFGQIYYQSAYSVVWGADTPGNNEMMASMAAAMPDRRPSDVFVTGWNEAVTMHKVLEVAIGAGDLTRSGVVDAAQSIVEIDFGGTAPNQRYAGTPNDYVQRSHAMYKPDLSAYLVAGGADQTISQSGATTGSVLIRDFWSGAMAQAFVFRSPCAEVSAP